MTFKFKKRYILILIILFFSFNHVIIKPFPFFNVDYIADHSKFNESPLNDLDFYEIKLDQKSNFSENIQKEILDKKNEKLFKKILYATELTRSIQEKSLGNRLKIYEELLLYDDTFYEICSESSKIFSYIMAQLGEYTRIIWLNGHTVTEVWHDDKWIFTDTSSNVFAFNKNNNTFASLVEIIDPENSIEFKTISQKKYKLWDYRYDSEKLHLILEKNNLIFVISNKKVFNFHQKNEKIKRILNSLIFNNINKAKQFVGYKEAKKVGNFGINIFKLL